MGGLGEAARFSAEAKPNPPIAQQVWVPSPASILVVRTCRLFVCDTGRRSGGMGVRIEYWCGHCKHLVGQVNCPEWTLEQAERFCGLHTLSPVEHSEWVAYDKNNGVLSVQTVCDYCQSAIERNPELLVEGKLLQ